MIRAPRKGASLRFSLKPLMVGLLCLFLTSCLPFQRQKSAGTFPNTETGLDGGNTAPEANGSGYGGGDGMLTEVRKLVIRGMYELGNQADLDTLATSGTCIGVEEPLLCNRLLGLTSEQQNYVRAFAAAIASNVLALNIGPSPTAFRFSTQPLMVTYADGSIRQVAAKTKLGTTGDIEFYAPALTGTSQAEQMALLVHEFGHKIAMSTGAFINDIGPVGPFTGPDGGRQLLDAYGAAVAVYMVKRIGKTSVMFPQNNTVCQSAAMSSILQQAAYFLPPDADEDVVESQVGQSSPALTSAFNRVKANPFTLYAIARADNDIRNGIPSFKGNAIVSNMDSGLPYSGWANGFILLRLSNGHLGVYASNGKLLDTGLVFSTGSFHFIAVKRNAGKIFVYFDQRQIILDDLYYSHEIDGGGEVTYQSSPNTNGVDTENAASADAPASIGKQGLNGAYCNPRANAGVDYACVDAWKGHIASVSFYPAAISDAKILAEYKCVSGNSSITQFQLVTPGSESGGGSSGEETPDATATPTPPPTATETPTPIPPAATDTPTPTPTATGTTTPTPTPTATPTSTPSGDPLWAGHSCPAGNFNAATGGTLHQLTPAEQEAIS